MEIDDDVLNIILDDTFTSEEYIKAQKKKFIDEQSSVFMKEEYGNIGNISDIIDAIYEGEFKSNVLLDDRGQTINKVAGHGIPYYSCRIEYCFCEIIANYSAIIKSKDCNELLIMLKDIIGDELYNLISDFYNNNIIYYNDNVKTL